MRKRKSGETSIARSAFSMPKSKSPSSRPLLVERQQGLEVGVGDRTAEGAAAEAARMVRAQGSSSLAVAGRQTKILARLGVSPGPVML